MSNLPFYFPDNEVKLRIGKTLLLLSVLSKETKKEYVFTLERIAQFEFIAKHPVLLNKLLDDKDKKILSLNNSEKYSIEAMFPNRGQLFDFTKIKLLLSVLISYGYVDIKTGVDFQVYYLINEQGISKAKDLRTTYFQRLAKVLIQMKPLLNMPHSKINQIIQSYL